MSGFGYIDKKDQFIVGFGLLMGVVVMKTNKILQTNITAVEIIHCFHDTKQNFQMYFNWKYISCLHQV